MIQNRLGDCYREINELKSTENKNVCENKVETAITICSYLTEENQRSTVYFKSPRGLFKHEKTFNSTNPNITTSPVLLIQPSLAWL